MNFRLFVSSVVPLVLLAGCATRPVGLADARPVASRRLLADYDLYAHPAPYGAKLVIIRDSARLDALETVKVLVDGRPVAILRSGERLDLHVYSGDRILSLLSTPGFLDSFDSAHAFVFQPGRTYYFRVGVAGHSLDLRPAAPSK